jgi:uncharacterized membrane protein (DUF373 family)
MASNSDQKKWQKLASYESFERVALGSILFILSAITVVATGAAVIQLIADLKLGESFLEKAALQEAFGSILTIIILLEFNHSIYVAFKHKLGVIQVRAVVLIAVLVIARKLMLLDFGTTSFQTILGFGGLLLVLGVLYWLIANADRPNITSVLPRATSNVGNGV